MTWVWVLLAVVIAVCLYGYSLHRHPWGRPCSHCEGTGRHYGNVHEYAYGNCRWCKGRPQRPRLGVRLFRHDQYLAMRAGMHGKWH